MNEVFAENQLQLPLEQQGTLVDDGKIHELLTVVLLAAMGGAEVQVKSHVFGALKVGNTKEEVVCTLVHASGYMGIPRHFNAFNTCKDLLADKESI